MLLTGITLLSLWMLQISFIRPYYERNRTQVINQKAIEIERLVHDEEGLKDSDRLTKLLSKENMCGSIYDENGRLIMTSSGSLVCILNSLPTDSILEYIIMAQKSVSSQFSIRFSSDIFDQGMYFYGKEVQVNDKAYYIFINSPLELLDSTVFVIRRQFALLAAIVFTVATLISFLLSRHLARPIERLNNSAHKLAEGDFDVEFDGEGVNEMESLADTLNYATSEFRKTNELRRDLVANVSHDYKTPLTMIKAYAEMIQDISGDDPIKRNEHLNVILDEVNHLELLVNDMLTLSKYESKMYEVKKVEYNLLDNIQQTVSLFQLDDWDVNIVCDFEINVFADQIKMGQVLYNYISNAVKYADQKKKLDIVVKDIDSETVMVSVIDYGDGLDEHEQSLLWDRYYKVDKNHHRQTSQSGLGLSIVKAICQANGSDFGVKSKPSEGSEFYYTLKKQQV